MNSLNIPPKMETKSQNLHRWFSGKKLKLLKLQKYFVNKSWKKSNKDQKTKQETYNKVTETVDNWKIQNDNSKHQQLQRETNLRAEQIKKTEQEESFTQTVIAQIEYDFHERENRKMIEKSLRQQLIKQQLQRQQQQNQKSPPSPTSYVATSGQKSNGSFENDQSDKTHLSIETVERGNKALTCDNNHTGPSTSQQKQVITKKLLDPRNIHVIAKDKNNNGSNRLKGEQVDEDPIYDVPPSKSLVSLNANAFDEQISLVQQHHMQMNNGGAGYFHTSSPDLFIGVGEPEEPIYDMPRNRPFHAL